MVRDGCPEGALTGDDISSDVNWPLWLRTCCAQRKRLDWAFLRAPQHCPEGTNYASQPVRLPHTSRASQGAVSSHAARVVADSSDGISATARQQAAIRFGLTTGESRSSGEAKIRSPSRGEAV